MNVPDQPLSHGGSGARTRIRCVSIGGPVAALPDLGEAIHSFQPAPGLPAGGECCAEWLAERALSETAGATRPPGLRLKLQPEVTGVYALCAAQIALSREAHPQAQLGVHYRITGESCSRNSRAPRTRLASGDEMLRLADTPARAARWSTSVC